MQLHACRVSTANVCDRSADKQRVETHNLTERERDIERSKIAWKISWAMHYRDRNSRARNDLWRFAVSAQFLRVIKSCATRCIYIASFRIYRVNVASGILNAFLNRCRKARPRIAWSRIRLRQSLLRDAMKMLIFNCRIGIGIIIALLCNGIML